MLIEKSLVLMPFLNGIRIINKNDYKNYKGGNEYLNNFVSLYDIFNSENFCVFLLDHNNCVVYANLVFAKLYGFETINNAINQDFSTHILFNNTYYDDNSSFKQNFFIQEETIFYKAIDKQINTLVFRYPQYIYTNKGYQITGIFGLSINLSTHNIAHFLQSIITYQLFPKYLNEQQEETYFFSSLGLTSRERACLHLIREGKTAKIIAKELNISYKTVEYHAGNIRRKLKAFSKQTNCNKVRDLLVNITS